MKNLDNDRDASNKDFEEQFYLENLLDKEVETKHEIETSDQQIIPKGTRGKVVEILAKDRVYVYFSEHLKVCLLLDSFAPIPC